MEVIFDEIVTVLSQKYTGLSNPVEHLSQCHMAFAKYPRQEWVHHFIHTLEMTPRTWYTSMELRQGTRDWDEVVKKFMHTFVFADEQLIVDVVLQAIK